MLTYNMDVTPESVWKRTTPSEAELAQPYYCTEAVAPGDMTGVLCEPMVLETGTGLDGSTIYQMVEVLAEAIQAAPAEAASSAWGVTIADGVITAVQ